MFLPLLLLVCAAVPARQGAPRYTVIGASGTAGATVTAVREAVEEGLDKLEPLFPGAPSREFLVVVHETSATLPLEVREWLHPGAPGVALLGKDEIHLILSEIVPGGGATLQSVVEHELLHGLLDQLAGPAANLPRWFHEGMAQDLSGARYVGAREQDLIGPARFGNLLTFGELRSDFPREEFRLRQAYAQSFSFVAYLRRELGHDALLEIAKTCGAGQDFSRAFVERTGHARVFYEDEWIDYLENDSGAAERVVLQNCFAYLIILAAPVLALAVIRRLARDRHIREKLMAAEDEEERSGPPD